MRISYRTHDYGRQHTWAAQRGPFQHAVRAKPAVRRARRLPRRKPRVSVKLRRRAINVLKRWAATTMAPRDRLSIIRRRRIGE